MGSPVVFILKQDGTICFCIDYRKLQSVTVRDDYPLSRMDESIDALGSANGFKVMDGYSGYSQIKVDEEDEEKTTFTYHDGLHRYVRMPFVLKNIRATF